MERQQHQHRAKQPRPSLSTRSRQPVQTSKAAFSLSWSGWALALVILGSVWVVVVIIAVTAVSGLLSPNASSPNASSGNQVSGAATIRETTQTATNSHARIPLWLFGAIALSCAAGSLLVSKQANRPPRSRKSIKIKPLAPYPVTTAIQPTIAIQPPSPSTSRPQPQLGVIPSFVLNPRQVQHPAKTARPSIAPPTLMQLAHQEFQSATGQATDVPVTVVPSEDKHPLDWGEASLADQLDIRKRRSISSLL